MNAMNATLIVRALLDNRYEVKFILGSKSESVNVELKFSELVAKCRELQQKLLAKGYVLKVIL